MAYYLIGSKYGENANIDMFPLMEEYSVVSTGYAGYDLSQLYRCDQSKIITELKKKGEASKSYNTLKYFLSLKPGDILAIKSSGAPKVGNPFLEIVAYALVVEKENIVYWYDKEKLGHCINVEFIKTGINKKHSLGGYARTIHHITDKKLINILFNNYISENSDAVITGIKTRRRNRKATLSKATSTQYRLGSAPYIANTKHNQIQQSFKEYLEKKFGKENVILEENNVDIKLFQEETITFYEIKPYHLAEDCITSALGQLLSYVFFDQDERNKNIIIVGPNPPYEDEQQFIDFLKKNISINFDYEYFNVE